MAIAMGTRSVAGKRKIPAGYLVGSDGRWRTSQSAPQCCAGKRLFIRHYFRFPKRV